MDVRMVPSIARALRTALSDPRDKHRVMEALGWDNSQVSRYLSGQMGIVEEKLDAVISAVGYVTVSPDYLNAMATLCKVGANCECARSGMGECGSQKVHAKRAA